MSTLIDDLYVSMMSKCPVLSAPTDWKETTESHKFIVDLPGLKKEEVNVQVVDGERVIEISGERKTDKDEDHDKWHRAERCRGKFLRRFRLPENAKTDQVEASMENGVLVVTVPKLEIMKPEKKVIQIEGN